MVILWVLLYELVVHYKYGHGIIYASSPLISRKATNHKGYKRENSWEIYTLKTCSLIVHTIEIHFVSDTLHSRDIKRSGILYIIRVSNILFPLKEILYDLNTPDCPE